MYKESMGVAVEAAPAALPEQPVRGDAEVVELLTRARELVEHGWTKGVWKQERVGFSFRKLLARTQTSYCLVGALGVAGGLDETSVRASWFGQTTFKRAFQHVEKSLPHSHRGYSPMTFNDLTRTTKKDVLDVLDRAIVRAKQCRSM